MAENVKIGHFWNPLCVNFQKMVLEVKKIILQAPRPWNSTSSDLGRFWQVHICHFFHSDLFWAGPAFLMYSLAEAYDVVNQRGLSKWQSKNIYSAKSINTSITFMIQNHSITKWQRSGMNNLYSDQILTATCPLHFLLVGHINTELLTPLKNMLWNKVAAQHRDFTLGTRGKRWT